MSGPAMTEDEMLRALVAQGVPRDLAKATVRRDVLARAASGMTQAAIGVEPHGISVPATTTVKVYGRRTFSSNGVLTHYARDIRGGLSLTLKTAPRTKKNSQAWLGVQSPAYRRYRDDIIAALVPLRMAYGEPILPDREYNCAATFYVDKKGEQSDFNGLNQGLHDALENAGVIGDDWYFRTCDGTRIVFGDELPRVDVLITPLTTGT